jgi:hypothetical protein
MAVGLSGCEAKPVAVVNDDDTALRQVGSPCNSDGSRDCDAAGYRILLCNDGHWIQERSCVEEGLVCLNDGASPACEEDPSADETILLDIGVDEDDAKNDDDSTPVQVFAGADCTNELDDLDLSEAFGCSGDSIMICSSLTGKKWRTYQDCAKNDKTCWVSSNRKAAYCVDAVPDII